MESETHLGCSGTVSGMLLHMLIVSGCVAFVSNYHTPAYRGTGHGWGLRQITDTDETALEPATLHLTKRWSTLEHGFTKQRCESDGNDEARMR